ncbi:glycoside hydrolase family 3 N-terminal domain-containing protein [Erwinia sp. 9145]|uniref:glycoside hydrolase family 3 protein n=1 Tax=Erwinia sp. 9145 TaxID=1500895 RepID=UPI00054D2D10|nr:glycoside hydrolase family 3 N-terminal domain-containing protein [Erwinia sp. 9145]
MKINPLLFVIGTSYLLPLAGQATEQIKLGHRVVSVIQQDGLLFKDLNKDETLNPYEDWRLSPEARARDLLSRMTPEEKAGVMMHGSAPAPGSIIGIGSEYDLTASAAMIIDERVNTFITRLSTEPAKLAEQNNRLQEIAEGARLGIPLTISIDPVNTYRYLPEKTATPDAFSKWPETTGLAAIGDENLVKRYADIGRQEYRLLGITQALSPMADLATEPRWSRLSGTFGEDAQLTRRMVRGYVAGMQNGTSGLNAGSVSTVVKHWAGYGASENGFDGHSVYGKYADFSGNNLDEHLIPFTGAFEVNTAGVMPTYAILKNLVYKGKKIEQVGAGFNHYLLQDLLRQHYKFDGVIISDWMITADCVDKCIHGHPEGEAPDPSSLGMPWGVESLTEVERFARAVNAGINQFGGVTDTTPLLKALKAGKVSEEKINDSVRRLLEQKIALGLFENAYVDVNAAKKLPNAAWQQEADRAQRLSLVLLEKKTGVLPVKARTKVWLHGVNADEAKKAGLVVVDQPQKADIAIARIVAPFEQPHKNYFFGAQYHEGSLAFRNDDADIAAIAKLAEKMPVIVTVYLDRPAILTPLRDKASVLIGNFGVSDTVLFTALMDGAAFSGKLPFELPSSMESVLKQHSDRAADSEHPLYTLGFGLK